MTAVGGTEFNDAGARILLEPSERRESRIGSLLHSRKSVERYALGRGWWPEAGVPACYTRSPGGRPDPGVPNDQARDVPDVSLAASGAHDGYVMYFRGTVDGRGRYVGVIAGVCRNCVDPQSLSRRERSDLETRPWQHQSRISTIWRRTRPVSFTTSSAGNNIVPCAAGSKGCVNGSFGYTAGRDTILRPALARWTPLTW